MKSSLRWYRYHPDLLKNCPAMSPYMDYAATSSGELSMMVLTGGIPLDLSSEKSKGELAGTIEFVSIMSGIPAEALLAFALSIDEKGDQIEKCKI